MKKNNCTTKIKVRLGNSIGMVSNEYRPGISSSKTVDTTGNCQRPVFSLNVHQHKHKISNL